MTTITKASAPQRATALGARQFKFVISTADLDRTGDRIEPRGWQLDDYRRNPVVLFGHRHDVPAIAKASYIAVEGPQLVATATFPPEGLHPLADTVHGLLREGFLTSASVGSSADPGVAESRRRDRLECADSQRMEHRERARAGAGRDRALRRDGRSRGGDEVAGRARRRAHPA